MTTLDRAKQYTDDVMSAHTDAADPHPQYAQMLNVLGEPTSGRIILAHAGDPFPAPDRNAVLISPGGIYLTDQAGAGWVKLGQGPIPIDVTPPSVPTILRATGVTTSTITLAWNASTDTESGVAGYEVAISSTGPFIASGPTTTKQFTGLNAGTAYTFRVRAVDGAGNTSPEATIQVTTTTPSDTNPPGSPPNFRTVSVGQNSVSLAWDAAVDTGGGTVARYEVSQDSTTAYTSVGNLLSTTRTGLSASTAYTFRVRAVDTSGNVSSVAQLTVTTGAGTIGITMLMGVSDSDENHGGFNSWDVWRTYSQGENTSRANQVTGKPKRLAFTDGGAVKTGYQGTYDRMISVLEDFYYGTGSAERKNVRLDIANGNEYADKVTTATVAAFVEGCRGIYEATRRTNGDGTRRYPLAQAWLDPTHFQEQSDIVQRSLHPAARYLDGVAWSMYPPGRNQPSNTNPTYNRPSLLESDRTISPQGFLIRCWYRTKQAVLQARTDRNDPTFKLQIACWEIGTGVGPAPNNTWRRPYYMATLASVMWQLTQQYSDWISDMPVNLYWDQQKATGGVDDASAPLNKLSYDPAGANPSTALAWRNWTSYIPSAGGTKPALWSASTPYTD